MQNKICIITFYKFIPINDLKSLKLDLENITNNNKLTGTILVAPEGINGTIEGKIDNINNFLNSLKLDTRFGDIEPKYSYYNKNAFNRMKVRIKKEIVTIGDTSINPNKEIGKYIDPLDWNNLISSPETIVIDTRNNYEVSIGTFNGALNPKTKSFRDLPKWIDELSSKENNIKNKKIAMFCTGGIRCEKATSLLVKKGFKDVYHLKGGILKYLEKVNEKESLWHGECFVFDHRVSIIHDLKPGNYDMCHACRMPLKQEDKLDKTYLAGVSCKYCFDKKSPEMKKRYADRQKQIELAKIRGEKHIGKKMHKKPKKQKISELLYE